MEIKLVKQYLEMVLDLEAKKLATKRMIASVQREHFNANLEPMEVMRVHRSGTGTGSGCGLAVGLIVGEIISLFLLAVHPLVGLLSGLLVCPCAAAVIYNVSCDRKAEKAVREANEQIQSRNEKRKTRNAKKQEIAAKQNELLEVSVSKLQDTYDKTEQTLQHLYAQGIIHPKYREPVALSYIYEYLDTGICDGLEGANGAYRQYETDVRMDRIISDLGEVLSRLDTVVMKMDRILWKMDSMHQTFVAYAGERQKASERLQETINRISGQIKTQSEQLNEIGVNTAVTAYTAKVIERNQYYERNWNNTRLLYDRIHLP